MTPTAHHIWCNRHGDPAKCTLCAALWAKYIYDPNQPPHAGDLARQHFKNRTAIKGKR